MKERKRIGILYGYNENWIAGTYYIHNLIYAFKSLEDERQPSLIVYTVSKQEYDTLRNTVDYPYMTHAFFPKFSIIGRVINKVSSLLLNQQIVKKKLPVELLFPVWDDKSFNKKQCLYWIPDFQEHYLPHLFSEEEIDSRKKWQTNVSGKEGIKIIFSSYSAFNDYKKIYPFQKSQNYVVPFAVTHSSFEYLDIDLLKSKYGMKGDYFISPNQFWVHKNHRVVIDAVKILKTQGIHVTVVFTGKPHDPRSPGYFEELKTYVQGNNLEENILFLGFIDRQEQLCLMKHGLAVIQPSMFEGWSTVIEDAKAMDQLVIASGIEVHKEQIRDNVFFFETNDPVKLAEIMKMVGVNKPDIKPLHYNKNVNTFAELFLKVLE